MGLRIGGRVEKVNGKELSYVEFAEKYMGRNQPVVLTGLMDDWRACRDWVTDGGKPNLQFFSTHFGTSKVQVAECGTREFTDQRRIEMTVAEFINCAQLSESTDGVQSFFYLKDWHFVKEYPEYVAYKTPLHFCDDWLNLYLDKYRMHNDPDTYNEGNEISCSDYRFVYIGSKGTWTPLHADVFRSYSWSANVCGRKKWYFLPPSQHHLVYDRNMKNSVYNIFADVNEVKFPGFKKAIWWECTQEQNELIFVPSGWYHQVENLEDTISINHNWFNAYNLSCVWDLLLRDYLEAQECIEDLKGCDDFEELCQRNLAANTGLNIYDFFVFMVRFALSNMVQLYNLTTEDKDCSSRSFQMGRHLVLNLKCIRSIALKMKSTAMDVKHGILTDRRKELEDELFGELCTCLGKTYGLIHEQSQVDHNIDKVLLKYLESNFHLSGCPVSDSEDLATLIDNGLMKLGGCFID
ncbi:2-oxoglutarate and iron-dependent oxygenase JMJD4 isoform X2 [Ipomoea triloba]|uniref:2-oxoglutarate and iron-dependent oxygenase JMJD4 isoform X2 n=1 Tax=Ipomoea triloba TaxID=35885 RepID=UPI00125D2FBE|nr:2-oxoglutarate and iron-dependent oxygenase JMJD4 isoform X2 [Ipomoea triloba]